VAQPYNPYKSASNNTVRSYSGTSKGVDPSKYTFYGSATDVGLAKQSGAKGTFRDISGWGQGSVYDGIMHNYKTGGIPVILGGAGATGGINDDMFNKLKGAGIKDLTRIGGKDRYEVQGNFKNFLNTLQNNQNFEYNPSDVYKKAVENVSNNMDPKKVDPFKFDYKNLSYGDATKQVQQQLDPLYQRAVAGVKQEQYQNELDTGEVAAKRGLAHSGLAADAQTKVAIAAQNNISDLDAKRASQSAEMATALVQRDQDRADRLRQQAYSEYMGGQDLQYRQDQTAYEKWMDTIGREDRNKEFEYGKFINDRDFRNDNFYRDRDFETDKLRYEDEKKWREFQYRNLSEAEKKQFDWLKQQHGDQMAWNYLDSKMQSEAAKSSSQAEIDYYNSLGLGAFLD
jgi:hypothetical protein